MSDIHIPLSRQEITDSDKEMVISALESGRLAGGVFLEKFEAEFAEKVGAKYALATSSGTAALHLAVLSLGIKETDEVITTPFSFVASSNCILYANANPVFVDIEEETLGLNPNKIRDCITDQTAGILPVHVFGAPCRIDQIKEIAEERNLFLLEDNCEAILAKCGGRITGSFGEVATYGFYPNKQMTTGEGGVLTTNNPSLYQMARSLRNQGRNQSLDIIQENLGFNYRISELTASLGLSQLRRLDKMIERRENLAKNYLSGLSEINGIRLITPLKGNKHSWFSFVIRVDQEIRDEIIYQLGLSGIQAKGYFSPCIHLQPYYKRRFGFSEGMLPVAEKVSKEVIALPFFSTMTEKESHTVVQKLREIFDVFS